MVKHYITESDLCYLVENGELDFKSFSLKYAGTNRYQCKDGMLKGAKKVKS